MCAFAIVIRASFFSEVVPYKITYPLVTAVIIGDYGGSTLLSIKEASKDYQNIIESFNGACGYTVVVAQNGNHNDDYTLKYFGSGNAMKYKLGDFKCKWTSDEIEDFNEKINADIIESENGHFDSLIYIVSCHGDGKNSIYDSNGENFSLSFIYHQFDNKNCKIWRDKPKIFLHDIYKNGGITADSNIGNDLEEKKVDISEIVGSKNKHSSVLDKAVAATYTMDSHYRKIFGNSGQLPRISNDKTDWISTEMQNGSIFIQCFSDVLKNSSSGNLTGLLNKTRKKMATKLHLPQHNDNAIVLTDYSTMPYGIEFKNKINPHENKNDEYANTSLAQTVCKCINEFCLYISLISAIMMWFFLFA